MPSWSEDLGEPTEGTVLQGRCLGPPQLGSGPLRQLWGRRHLPQEAQRLRLPEVPGRGQEQGSLGENPQKQEKWGTLLLLPLLLQRPDHRGDSQSHLHPGGV